MRVAWAVPLCKYKRNPLVDLPFAYYMRPTEDADLGPEEIQFIADLRQREAVKQEAVKQEPVKQEPVKQEDDSTEDVVVISGDAGATSQEMHW